MNITQNEKNSSSRVVSKHFPNLLKEAEDKASDLLKEAENKASALLKEAENTASNLLRKASLVASSTLQEAAATATSLIENNAKEAILVHKKNLLDSNELYINYKNDVLWLATIVQTSEDAIISKKLDGTIQSWNIAASELFGYTSDEIIGQPISILIHPDKISDEDNILFRLKKGERIKHAETIFLTKDKSPLNVSVSSSPIVDSKGQVVGVAKIIRDITDKIKKNKELEEAQGIFKTIFEESFQLMGILKPDGTVIQVNKTALSIIKSEKTDLKNIPFWETPWWTHSPKQQELIRLAVKAASQGETKRFDVEHLALDGTIIYVDFSIKPVKDKNGNIIYLIPEGREITDRKKTELELIAAGEASRNLAQIKSRFLDIAAHELRTPVTSFYLVVQFAQKQLEKGHPVEASTLLRLRLQAERISRLVVDLLDVSRLERNTIKLQLQMDDMSLLILEAVAEYKILKPNKRIIFLKPSEEIKIKIDHIRIYQVVSNIISNAIKYTPDDCDLEILIEKKPDFVRVSFTDSGPGISDEQKKVLFSPFTRGSSELTGRSGGLGLGLYISKMIIELHGGTIGVISKLGVGSTFYFELPISKSSEEK